MPAILVSIVIAIVVACIIGLVLLFIGRVLQALTIPIAVMVGSFLEQWCWVIGLLCGILFFLTGGSFLGIGGHK